MITSTIDIVKEEFAKVCAELHICTEKEGESIKGTDMKYRQTLLIYDDVTDYIKRNFIQQCVMLANEKQVETMRILGAFMRSCSQDAYLNSPLTLFVEDMVEHDKMITLKVKFIQGRLESILNPNFNASEEEIREFINLNLRSVIGNGLLLVKFLATEGFVADKEYTNQFIKFLATGGGFAAYKEYTNQSQQILNKWISEAKDPTEEEMVRLMHMTPMNKDIIEMTNINLDRYYALCDIFIW